MLDALRLLRLARVIRLWKLGVLLENLDDTEGASRALVFGVITEMLKQDNLISGFHAFTELIILKVLQAHKDPEKDVSVKRESGSES